MCFFFNDTATTEIYTLSLHDALPIYPEGRCICAPAVGADERERKNRGRGDRKSTRLNSSHSQISYAVFCLQKKSSELRCAYCHHKATHVASYLTGSGCGPDDQR